MVSYLWLLPIATVGTVVYLVARVSLDLRRAPTTRGILRRLAEPGGQLTVRTRRSGATWNPAKPLGPNNRLFGAGTGRYRREPDGRVTLEWQPRSGQSVVLPATSRTT